ncbi:N alpha-acetyl-transferase [Exophiala dermatitidis]|uniref:N-alpha-acetyltransferase 40 n=2 Tax=Exophiala dermatitidis TaxID=5970 RepID=H6BNR1_EXODN|nr:GNAT family acetyltransferase Nat4 [Exophiala dermatitidis NIH/UT8656]KAJ4514891.1 N alpha-acetyl-transferase [Exophiala dermatitidis]EHY52246.1 GNAT family acetyltransferase Nat4 [Exophiala dermatitidis NIH/UT8656]KAJ4518361.1 N alpha-acetyl-transferase [Exophiala dermatitidis]KAJ4521259.1 N alpha-acetyl-transferase [Exophiala dermatitidis]KAJ4547851.1 N alpha-acetyl-transferase [Exophiala dermatitidis]
MPKLNTVEAANALSASDFFETYDKHTALSLDTNAELQICKGDASHIPAPLFEQCLKLIELTSAQDYRNSEMKWSVSSKRKEMKLPDMRYIILVEKTTSQLAGFISFMITYEDGYEVVYIYEIHFTPEWQGRGLGRELMKTVEDIGQRVGVSKAMLTVFKANSRAVRWYHDLGYREDDFSPGPRVLRNGTVKEPSYIILSKQLND